MAFLNSWINKYEPDKLSDMVLHPVVRNQLENVLINPQNMILYGKTGVGKGTFTKIFLKERKAISYWINASDKTGIEYIRKDVAPFATSGNSKQWFCDKNTESFNKEYKNLTLKFVVFNEAENLSPEAQASLRELMEQVEKITKFIFMANKIIKDDAIQSRCRKIDIKEPPKDEILRFTENILKNENIDFERGILATYVQDNYPDIRKTINEIQGNCNENKLYSSKIISLGETINKVFLDLKLYIKMSNLNIRKVYNELSEKYNVPVSERQFYYLLRDPNTKSVSPGNKNDIVNIIKENIPIKEWYSKYHSIND